MVSARDFVGDAAVGDHALARLDFAGGVHGALGEFLARNAEGVGEILPGAFFVLLIDTLDVRGEFVAFGGTHVAPLDACEAAGGALAFGLRPLAGEDVVLHGDGVTGAILGEDAAFAIEDFAADGGEPLLAHEASVGLAAEVRTFGECENAEACGEGAEAQASDGREQQESLRGRGLEIDAHEVPPLGLCASVRRWTMV